MLEGLEAVRWSELTHAYGAASDVPELLRALTDPDPASREEALWELYGNIWHQNSVYEATAHAVPFLVEIAVDPSVPDREEVLPLLSAIANGSSYHDVHQDVGFLQERVREPEWQEAVRRELVWVTTARDAVRAGVPAYVRLLEDASPAVRAAAAYVLANFSGEDAAVDPALRARLDRERDPLPRASLLRALGAGPAEATTERAALFTGILRSEGDPLTRLAAAMALAMAARERIPADAVDLLVAALTEPTDLEQRYRELPWNSDGLAADAATHLLVLGPAAATVLPRVLEALRKAAEVPALRLAQVALEMAFGSALPSQDAKVSDLSADQLAVLTTLQASPKAWRINVNLANILRAYRLPDGKDSMATFLGGDITIAEASARRSRAVSSIPRPAGLLDRVRAFVDRWRARMQSSKR